MYTESIDLAPLGPTVMRRASHVEPDDAGGWWADLEASGGGRLGPFGGRSAALAAERQWLSRRLAARRENPGEVPREIPVAASPQATAVRRLP